MCHVMWLTYGQTVCFHGMINGCVMWLTFGWTSHVDGMTDGCLLSVTYACEDTEFQNSELF